MRALAAPYEPLVPLQQHAGVKEVVTIRARQLADVEDPKTLELLKKANGVWFGGGRQWNFMDAYAGTKFEKELHEVLQRGVAAR